MLNIILANIEAFILVLSILFILSIYIIKINNNLLDSDSDNLLKRNYIDNNYKICASIAIFSVILSLFMAILTISDNNILISLFSDSPRYDFIKLKDIVILIILALFLLFLISINYYKIFHKSIIEFYILMISAVIGSIILVSASNLLQFYVAIELQALSMVVMAYLNYKDNNENLESILKYFLISAISSIILLFAISLIYGIFGSIYFLQIFENNNNFEGNYLLYMAIILLIIAIITKIGLFPFHSFMIDIYHGSSIIANSFFIVIGKFAMIIAFAKIYIIFSKFLDLSYFILLLSLFSIFCGNIIALKQKNFKRLLAYSSLSNSGFIFLALINIDIFSIKIIIIYSVIYSIIIIGIFAILFNIKYKNNDKQNHDIYDIVNFSGLSQKYPIHSLLLAILLFSLSGIPPLAGFFGKFYILYNIISENYLYLAIVTIILTIISLFYYANIVKIIYFEKYNDNLYIENSYGSIIIAIFAVIFNISMIFFLENINNYIFNIILHI